MQNFINLNEIGKNELVFDKPGEYVVFFKNLSGKILFSIDSENVNLNIYGLYLGYKNEQFQIETIQHHAAPRSTSNLFIKGVFYDTAKFKYQGLIRIEKEAQKSHAYQRNQNLLMSPNCFIESKPYLEILANDVFCTHGSSTGKPDWQQLFYLKSRSLSRKEAEDLLIEGFINEIKLKIKEKISNFNYD